VPVRIGREDKIEDRSRRSRFGNVVHSDSTEMLLLVAQTTLVAATHNIGFERDRRAIVGSGSPPNLQSSPRDSQLRRDLP
jgi:hypothetical protein